MLTAALLSVAASATTAVDGAGDGGFSVPGFFTTNFESIGGWSLFIGLCLFITVGNFLEWWVPGRRHRRVEAAALEQSKTLANAVEALKEQTQANEITKLFFEKTVPKRGEPAE